MSCECEWSLINPLQEIQHRKEKDPNQIDEMPEQARHLDSIDVPVRVGPEHLSVRSPDVGNKNRAAEHVKGVPGRQRKVNGKVKDVTRNEDREPLDGS